MSFPSEGAGKGDFRRPFNQEEYDKNYILAFGITCVGCNGLGFLPSLPYVEIVETKCNLCNGLGKVEKPRGGKNG